MISYFNSTTNLIFGTIFVATITYVWRKLTASTDCGHENPDITYKTWLNLKNGYQWSDFLESVQEYPDPENYKSYLREALDLKQNKDQHHTSLMIMQRIRSTIDRDDDLGDEILNYINGNRDLLTLYNESVQYYDLMEAFLDERGYIVDPKLSENVHFSYKRKGRVLKSRKFIKIIDKPILNVALRCNEIDHFKTWKWYQTGKLLEPFRGTPLCSIISVLSRFVILNRAAYCWKLNYYLPDGSLIISYNGANNRQKEYDLPPLPKGFAYPDIFYHSFRLIPLSESKTLIISVMESDPKIWFLTFEMFVRQAKMFGSRELVLIDKDCRSINGTVYQDKVHKPIYKKLLNNQ